MGVILEGMSVGTSISEQEYRNTSYSPDREYRDGLLVERNVGDNSHSLLQTLLASFLVVHRREWKIRAYAEFRIQVRKGVYLIPDLCAYTLPAPTEPCPTRLPFLWIEIISPDDGVMDLWGKAKELIACGVPYVWIIDPNTLDSELWTAAGVTSLPDKTLRIPETPIVIPLSEVVEE